jgi:uncharacterized protein (DUF1778 family)
MKMSSARLDMRLNEEIKIKAEKASALLGLKSLTDYVVQLIESNATQVIAQHESITVENDIFDRFMNACEEARPPDNALPNKDLLSAAAYTKKQGIK